MAIPAASRLESAAAAARGCAGELPKGVSGVELAPGRQGAQAADHSPSALHIKRALRTPATRSYGLWDALRVAREQPFRAHCFHRAPRQERREAPAAVFPGVPDRLVHQLLTS